MKNWPTRNWSAPTILYDRGAISQNDLQVAEDTDAKAKADVQTTAEKLRVLGNQNLDHPSGIVDIRAPISGVITDQQVTNAAGVARPELAQPFHHLRPELCLDSLRRLRKRSRECAAWRQGRHPTECLSRSESSPGRSAILAPSSIRTFARLKCALKWQPGTDAPGHVCNRDFPWPARRRSTPPFLATAILHLHDRDWVYVPQEKGKFRRVEVVAGDMLPGGHAGDDLGHRARSASGSERAGIPEHGGTVMIRALVDFALNNRFVVLGMALVLFAWGHRCVQQSAGRSLSRMWPTPGCR